MSQYLPNTPPLRRPQLPVSRIAIIWAVAAAVLLVVIWLASPFVQVSAGTIGVLTVFGAPSRTTLGPGLHFKTPFVSEVYPIDVTPNTATTTESAATHDQQNVSTSIAVTFQVNPADAVYIYQNYRDIPSLQNTIISPIVSNDVKAIVSIYDAQDLITKREQLADEIKAKIAADLKVYDVVVDGVNITNFDFSQAYDQAIENKQIAQQNALEESYHLQQVQVSAQQQVVQANAQADAAVGDRPGPGQSHHPASPGRRPGLCAEAKGADAGADRTGADRQVERPDANLRQHRSAQRPVRRRKCRQSRRRAGAIASK